MLHFNLQLVKYYKEFFLLIDFNFTGFMFAEE